MSKSLSSLIDIATDEKQTEDDWTKILDVCENGTANPKECFKLIMRRMTNRNPHVVLRCIILLDACVQNIGEPFSQEISSRYFVDEIKNRSKNMHQKTLEKLCFMTKKWKRELVGPQYDCIKKLDKWLLKSFPTIYAEGDDELSNKNNKKTSRRQVAAQEEVDLATAIALSLKETGGLSSQKQQSPKQSKSTLYPSGILSNNGAISSSNSAGNGSSILSGNNLQGWPNTPAFNSSINKIAKVRALYDFEAAEDNELSFKAGEVIVDVDTTDENWWFGHNHRGEGMFPAQFVTTEVEGNSTKLPSKADGNTNRDTGSVSGGARAQTPVIDEAKIDECLKLLDDADPTGELRADAPQLAGLELQCRQMAPLIDQDLEKVDRHYNMLSELNRKIMSAFQTYNELMLQTGSTIPNTNYVQPHNQYQPPTSTSYSQSVVPPQSGYYSPAGFPSGVPSLQQQHNFYNHTSATNSAVNAISQSNPSNIDPSTIVGSNTGYVAPMGYNVQAQMPITSTGMAPQQLVKDNYNVGQQHANSFLPNNSNNSSTNYQQGLNTNNAAGLTNFNGSLFAQQQQHNAYNNGNNVGIVSSTYTTMSQLPTISSSNTTQYIPYSS